MKLENFNIDKLIEFIQTKNGPKDLSELVFSLAVLADNYLLSNGYSTEDLPLVVKQQVNLDILEKVANIDYTEEAQEILDDITSVIKRELSEADPQIQSKILEKLDIIQHDIYELLQR